MHQNFLRDKELSGPASGFSALFIVEKGIVSSAAVTAWLGSGNTIVEFWTSDRRKLRPNGYERIDSLIGGFPNISTIARRHGIAIRKIENLSKSKSLLKAAADTKADTLITMFTHEIVPPDMIKLFGHRTINCHPALLPHYKGPQPRKSLLADECGETYGGITLHVLAPGIDEGDIIAQKQISLEEGQLPGRWQALAADAVKQFMAVDAVRYLRGESTATPQVVGSGNYRKVSKNEFFFTAEKTHEQVSHLARVLAPGELVWVPEEKDKLRKKRYRVTEQIANMGKPTGKPPSVSAGVIEADFLDCRLSMRRLHPHRRLWLRVKSSRQMRQMLTKNRTFQRHPRLAS